MAGYGRVGPLIELSDSNAELNYLPGHLAIVQSSTPTRFVQVSDGSHQLLKLYVPRQGQTSRTSI